MSIIEKAINAIGKGRNDESRVDSSDGQSSATVQRAEQSMSARRQSVTGGEPSVSRQTGRSAETGAGERVNIPFKDLKDRGILTPTTPRSAIAEEYRSIKRPLLINISGDSTTPPIPHGNLIIVTSALEGDGKTFSAICLALSIAMEQDKNVLLVDGDTIKGEAGKLLGVSRSNPGLIDLLQDPTAKPADYILDTNMEKLRILPAGAVHTHANELLASSRAQEVILELSDEDPSRVIVFDSPPLLLTTEAGILASFMGQIVFVVSADQTPQHAITQAIEHIGEDKMVGMILNRARRGRNPYVYSYGSDGSYGYAGSYAATWSGKP
ncbi:MAG: AAA family ATPase [Halioglobus sp.]|nr:AAA family ATPase [Halioglobus sp.]